MCDPSLSNIPLPNGWPESVRSAVVYVISLAHYAVTCARGWAANSVNARVRLATENDLLNQEIQLLREELSIKDARMAKIDPHRRPYYRPAERMAILELKAARAWSLAQTAKAFLCRLWANARPKYIICDKGPQFWCDAFKAWCKHKGVKPRFGAVGKCGSIAVVERFIRTLKNECIRRITILMRRDNMRRELICHFDWYNEHRPHEFLVGKTPNEVYHEYPAANEEPRIEVRPHWPPDASCAAPAAAIDGEPGRKIVLLVSYHAGRKHLPLVQLKRVA